MYVWVCGCVCVCRGVRAFVFAANCGVKHEYTVHLWRYTAKCGTPQLRSPHFHY